MSTLWISSERFNLTDHSFLLAMASSWEEAVDRSLGSAGVVPQRARTLEEAVEAIEFQQADFLILSEGFGDTAFQSDPLMEYIQTVPAASRRKFFVVYISPKLKSGDLWSAFSYGVNLVLQPAHLSELLARIEKSWLAWKDLYRVFLQVRT